jgi:hypothetical protein
MDLIPHRLNYGATGQFIYDTLMGITNIEFDPSVEQYCRADPESARAILALTTKVAQTGIRIRDANPKGDDIINDHLDRYSPEELWMCDLAIDVLAMFATSGGLHGDSRSFAQAKLKLANGHTHDKHWRHALKKAGDGPAEFRELRAHVPHRQQ